LLYWLHEFFNINILGYISIRAGISFFLALIFTLILLPLFIRWAQRTSSVQPINEWAPERHKEKVSTPTMGGIVFIGATIIASLLSINFSNFYAVGALLTLILFSFIGFQDDYAKIRKNENLAGLKARTKLAFQIIASLIVASYLCLFADFNTDLYVPFLKTPIMDMGMFAIVFWALVIVSTSNAVNLTDGLDGLATVPSLAALTSFSIIIYITGHAKLSTYLLMPNFDVGEVAIVAAALMGALTGFLWHNCHPAEVFMGDSGSLTLGFVIVILTIKSLDYVAPVVMLYLLALPLIDTLVVMARRKRNNRSIFSPDRWHMHHVLLDCFNGKVKITVVVLALVQVFYTLFGFFVVMKMPQGIALLLFILSLLGWYHLLNKLSCK